MKARVIGWGALVGGLLAAPLVALMYLGQQLLRLPFPPFDVFNWMATVLPGPVITFGIDSMISVLRLLGISVANTAKTAEQLMALILFVVLGIFTAALFFIVIYLRRVHMDLLSGLVLGLLYGLPITVISIGTGTYEVNPIVGLLWLGVLFLAWGAALGWSYRRLYASGPTPETLQGQAQEVVVDGETRRVEKLDRRQFLVVLGGSAAAITVVGAGLGAVLSASERQRQADEQAMTHDDSGSPSPESFPNANDPVTPAPGTRPEYTPLKDHYKVFIELEPTEIDGREWVLPITGMVDNPLMLTLDDLRENYAPRDQFTTLTCISGRIPTSLISTTLWTGCSFKEVLADAGVQAGARYVIISGGDGFYETVDLELINNDERIMLTYDWDGNPLPVDHGFPLRVWIPDRYGMKQPKWITGMEVTDTYQDGFWVERGWSREAIVKARSSIDTVAVDAIIENGDQRLVPIGGIAYAGDRGISAVEVRVDGGEWQAARLRAPLSDVTWVIWRLDWPFEAGQHTFEVRCREGDGTLQITEPNDPRPDGATGIHSVRENIREGAQTE